MSGVEGAATEGVQAEAAAVADTPTESPNGAPGEAQDQSEAPKGAAEGVDTSAEGGAESGNTSAASAPEPAQEATALQEAREGAPEGGVEGEPVALDAPAGDADQAADEALPADADTDGLDPAARAVSPPEVDGQEPARRSSPRKAPPKPAGPSVPLSHAFGFDVERLFNVTYLTETVLIHAVGNTVQMLDLETMKTTYLPGLDGGGIGAVAVHPSRERFAVCEKGRSPAVYVYSYPSLEVEAVLRGGAEKSFTCAAFDTSGERLATVAGSPDYWLTLWDWKAEETVLRSKAFAQEVYAVQFSPFFEGQLTTSGTGHVRFWQVASTFTGLKLQGTIGKFGNTELSDVCGFAELPDGKVLTGVESGRLLLWDGGLIKVEITRADGAPCHQGMIDWLQLDSERGVLYTAGADGFVRTWDAAVLDAADTTDECNHFELEPLAETNLSAAVGGGEGGKVHVRAVSRSPHASQREWTVQDGNGSLLKVMWPEGGPPRRPAEGEDQLPADAFEAPEVTVLARFHAGALTGLAASPVSHHAATCGVDGQLRLYDYRAQKVLYSRQFPGVGGASALLWLPSGVDASARTVAVGFADGVVRTAVRCADGWKLACAIKPHTGKVTALSLSPDCGTLVSAGTDGSVFLLRLSGKPAVLSPIGFVSAPSAPTTLAWSADSARVLVGCRQGHIVEVTAPDGPANTEHTFELQLDVKSFDFKRPAQVAPEKSAGEKEDTGEEESEEATPGAVNEGESPAGDDADGGDGAGDKAAVGAGAAVALEDEPLAEVTTLSYVKGGNDREFDATFGGSLSGEVFRCDLESGVVVGVAPLLPPAAAAGLNAGELSFSGLSTSGKLFLAGSADGRVHVRPANAPVPSGGDHSQGVYEAALHDGERGRIAGIACSFDDMTLLSGGGDGVLYVRDLGRAFVDQLGAGRAHHDGDVSAVPTVKMEPFVDGLDIVDPKAYSIEEAKQKTEEDNTMAAAERKKAHVREYIKGLRERFVALRAENDALGPAGLPAAELEVDPGLRSMIEAETQAKLERARAELAWESERKRLALEKLRNWFLADVEVERVVLRAFRSGRKIASIRTAKLSPALEAQIQEVHSIVAREERAKLEGGTASTSSGMTAREGAASASPNASQAALAAAHATDAAAADEGLSKQDLRRLQRKRREEEWRAFEQTRPDEGYENPADVAAIEYARANMGDFKLKTDPDYIMPEDQRINAEKKRRQMVLLAESIHSLKMGFNSKFFALRDLKRRLRAEVRADNARVREIDAQFGEESELFEPEDNPEEYPERRDEVTQDDLEEFKVLKAQEEAAAAAKAGGGFSSGGGGGANKIDAGAKGAGGARGAAAAGGGAAAAAAVQKSGMSLLPLSETEEAALSELERSERHAMRVRLSYEKSRLLDKARGSVEAFDTALAELRREKLRLEVDLKSADMKMLVLHRELDLLQECEIRDRALKDRYEAKARERADVVERITECQRRLEAKSEEVDALVESKKAIMVDFDRAVEEGSTFREPLQKIFLKKIKRIKKRSAEDDDDDYDSDDEEDEDDDEDYDEEEEEEACPTGCNQALYEKVCDLREQRLDQEDVIAEFVSAREQLKKDKDALTKKQKNIETGLKALDGELIDFEKEKQGKLNEIDVVVTLRMHQVEYLQDDAQRLPDDLSQALVFSRGALSKLRVRIKELVQEKAMLRRQQKELRREHINLDREKGVKERRITELQARAHDVQMLKFGQIIDLDMLDRMGANRGAEDMKANLRRQEEAHAQELRQLDSRIKQANAELSRMTAENTDCLNRVASLTSRKKDLDDQLASTQTTLFTDTAAARRKEIRERDRLVQLVNAQAKSIDALKAEINMLRRKGGHVFVSG